MLVKNTAARLSETVKGVETVSRFALAVLALASGVYTYLGVRALLDGSATLVFFAAIIYSGAVSVAIYAFWTFMLRFVPLVVSGFQRLALFAVMAAGSVMIIAMSSWLNAAALAGSAALEQHLAVTMEGYVSDLDAAHANALAAQSLLPDVQRASERFARLAQDERGTGALTGTSGAGSVVQLLTQMAAQLDELGSSIVNSRADVQALFEQGSERLAAMRELVSGSGPVAPRADAFGAEVVHLSAVIAALQETGIAPSVKRAAEDLSLGFIAPVADGRDAGLVIRQDAVMQTVRDSVAAQSAALAAAADEILAEPRVEARRFVPLSTAEAVIRYWNDFAPSWAGAISIDLLPVVLVLVLMVVHDAMRREAASMAEAETMTAAEMMRAVAIYRQMEAATGSEGPSREAAAPESDASPPVREKTAKEGAAHNDGAAEATITPIEAGQRKRGDGPART